MPTRKVEGVNAGHLIEIGARPNTGKTSFHASLIASLKRIKVLTASYCVTKKDTIVLVLDTNGTTGMTMKEIKDNLQRLVIYMHLLKNIKIKDATGRDMAWARVYARHTSLTLCCSTWVTSLLRQQVC